MCFILTCRCGRLARALSRRSVNSTACRLPRSPQAGVTATLRFWIAIKESVMKSMLSAILLAVLAAALGLPLAENSVLAQAPTGPQGGAPPPPQQQQNPAPPPAQTPAQQPPQAGVTIAVEVPIVTLDVVATTQHGDIIPGLKKENFRVFDDGVAQTITNFAPTEAPITTVMLLEFSSRGFYSFFSYYSRYWADAFLPQLQQKDWVALETFDMKTRIETDFTQNKDEVRNAIYHLYFP